MTRRILAYGLVGWLLLALALLQRSTPPPLQDEPFTVIPGRAGKRRARRVMVRENAVR